jgi:type I restriction enzyme M protein
MPRKNPQPTLPGLGQQTTPQQLSSIIKSARDKMRKDKGLSGDTDRLPQLTWIMFLKFLDDNERLRESEASLAGEKFKPAIAPPYRWRDWAGVSNGLTGDDLIAFINNDDALLPNGKRGPGLFSYLKSLSGENGGDRRDVIANVFRGTLNRMVSGYILREVLEVIDAINFTSSEEIHTLSALYESMLKEMRDASGDAGEFYTPRAVVRFMVKMVDPRLGESVLDPACGTGGFLVETFEHIRQECDSVEKLGLLQRGTIFGIEAKPLPYLLCQMNLLLHGLEFPHIDYTNSLAVRIGEIGERERVDVILTNPPFGGEEERSILQNFPADKQTTETALLFLQLIMRKLRRQPRGGRAAIVVPNGTLFGDGIAAKIKEELLTEFNLHTIVRLPNGVFSPYTSIPTNLLFFDRTGATESIWYYEQPLREDLKNYTKTKPMQFEEFQPLMDWWDGREDNERAWKVPAADVLKYNGDGAIASVNLDIKNPNAAQGLEHLPPEELVESILFKEHKITVLMEEIKALLVKGV